MPEAPSRQVRQHLVQQCPVGLNLVLLQALALLVQEATWVGWGVGWVGGGKQRGWAVDADQCRGKGAAKGGARGSTVCFMIVSMWHQQWGALQA